MADYTARFAEPCLFQRKGIGINMEYVHTLKNVGHSPRKMRLVADMVRKMEPQRALLTLQFVNRAAASDLSKAIKTALANAGRGDGLWLKSLEINEGYKTPFRGRSGGRGKMRLYRKKMSHIKIVLSDEVKVTDIKDKKENMENTDKKLKIDRDTKKGESEIK